MFRFVSHAPNFLTININQLSRIYCTSLLLLVAGLLLGLVTGTVCDVKHHSKIDFLINKIDCAI